MIPKNDADHGWDRRLKDALADDLPPEVEAGMRMRIAAFRSGRPPEGAASGAAAWLLRKGLWAAVASAMLLAGFLLQGFQARNALADRIAVIKKEISIPERGRPADLRSESRPVGLTIQAPPLSAGKEARS